MSYQLSEISHERRYITVDRPAAADQIYLTKTNRIIFIDKSQSSKRRQETRGCQEAQKWEDRGGQDRQLAPRSPMQPINVWLPSVEVLRIFVGLEDQSKRS